jgi:hypothetical protein
MEGEEVMNRLKSKIEVEKEESEKSSKPVAQKKPRQTKSTRATTKKRA